MSILAGQYKDQHIQLVQNSQTEFQEETFSHQAPCKHLCKYYAAGSCEAQEQAAVDTGSATQSPHIE